MEISVCKGCGRKIIWAENDKGQKIPLDASAPVYDMSILTGNLCARNNQAFVSHFSTCPMASQFSKKGNGK